MAVAKLQIALVSLVLLTQSAVRCQNELRVEWTVSGVAQYANSPLQVPLGYTVIFECQNNSFSNVIYQADPQQQDSCNSSATSGEHRAVGECRGSPAPIFQEITQNSNMLGGTVHYEPGRTYYFTSYSDGTLAGAITSRTSGGECLTGLKIAFEVTNVTHVTQSPDNSNGVSTVSTVSILGNSAATPTPVASPVLPTGGLQGPLLSTVHFAIIGAVVGVVIIVIIVLLVVLCCVCAGRDRSHKVDITDETKVEKGDHIVLVTTTTTEVGNGVGSNKLPLSTQSKDPQGKPTTQLAPARQSKPPLVESNQGIKLDPIKNPPSQQPGKASTQPKGSRSTAQAISNTPKGGTKSQGSNVEAGVTRAGPRKGDNTDPSTAPNKSNVTNKTGKSAPKDRRPTSPTQSVPPLGQRAREDTDASKSSNQKKQSGMKAQRTTPGVKKASSVGNEPSHPPVSKTMSDSSSPRRTSVTPRRPAPGIPMQRSQTVTEKPPSHDNSRKKNGFTAAVRNTPSTR